MKSSDAVTIFVSLYYDDNNFIRT